VLEGLSLISVAARRGEEGPREAATYLSIESV
jgi:hypothetical protein